MSFNTSHVTLYLIAWVQDTAVVMFQYISCYSLSRYRKGGIMVDPRFNTSHVTLYQTFPVCHSPYGRCFNTSHVTLYQRSSVG